MKVECEYCGSFIEDTDEKCEYCGAVNAHLVRSATGIPKTIAELLDFANEKKLPLKDMRFFIGENYTGARAFGIYYDEKSENFVVYKNKNDGTRAIRYEGKDESYAVNEIYQKLKSEVLNQRAMNIAGNNYSTGKNQGGSAQSASSGSGNRGSGSSPFKRFLVILITILIMGFIGRFAGCSGAAVTGGSLLDSFSSGYESDYDGDYGSYYDDDDSSSWWDSDDSWDSGDWDWGSDSWDSSGSDWDSDW